MRRILSFIFNYSTDILLDIIFLSLALFILFPHAQTSWINAPSPRILYVWGEMMSDWSIAKEGYTLAIVIMILWLSVKYWRIRSESKKQDKLREAIEANTRILCKVVEVLEKLGNK